MVIGYTAGVYDLFHIGHLNLLKNAKGMCDQLVVGVTTDDLVTYKGKHAMIPFEDRIEIVRSIKAAMEEQTIGSQQINQALHEMNESTVEVQTASREMADSNHNVLSEVEVLKETSLQMRQSMEEMSIGAGKINETGSELSDISSKLKNSIKEIGNEIDLFKV